MDANELLTAIKKAAVDAVEATKPVQVCFGQIISPSPLQVNVEQKMILGAKQVITTQAVNATTDRNLQAGDKVVLLRQQGGQQFIIIGRL